ncbi:hypothetical protein ACQPWY_07660 [Pseudonocardia xinjiangensis]|uniref:hypothetical protein n=1 Tax=Pseudonocardia xinjiangensis TaxID=75289 RepID=UPI003D93011C
MRDRSQYDRPVGHGHGSRRRKVGGQRSLAPMDIAMLQRSAGNLAVTRLIGLQRAGAVPGVEPEPTTVPRTRPVQRAFFGSSRDADVGATMAARRRQRLDHEYGPLAGPKRVKEESEFADDGDVRLNPVWYRLENIPPGLLLDRGKNAVWCFSVGARGEVLMGSEDITTVVEDEEWARLLTGMQEKDPTLTMDQLQLRLNAAGHPTIAAGFQPLGRTQVKPARVSGELRWNAETERFEINDQSGRYMSKKVRPGLERADAARWMTNLADRMAKHFGVPIGIKNMKFGE